MYQVRKSTSDRKNVRWQERKKLFACPLQINPHQPGHNSVFFPPASIALHYTHVRTHTRTSIRPLLTSGPWQLGGGGTGVPAGGGHQPRPSSSSDHMTEAHGPCILSTSHSTSLASDADKVTRIRPATGCQHRLLNTLHTTMR